MEKNFICAPIDNKNIMEDAFEDEVFEGFYFAPDHGMRSVRHLVGFLDLSNQRDFVAEAHVDVKWSYGGNAICIKVIAYNPSMADYEETRDEVFEYYKEIFSSWECEDNDNLRVRITEEEDTLVVRLYFECE